MATTFDANGKIVIVEGFEGIIQQLLFVASPDAAFDYCYEYLPDCNTPYPYENPSEIVVEEAIQPVPESRVVPFVPFEDTDKKDSVPESMTHPRNIYRTTQKRVVDPLDQDQESTTEQTDQFKEEDYNDFEEPSIESPVDLAASENGDAAEGAEWSKETELDNETEPLVGETTTVISTTTDASTESSSTETDLLDHGEEFDNDETDDELPIVKLETVSLDTTLNVDSRLDPLKSVESVPTKEPREFTKEQTTTPSPTFSNEVTHHPIDSVSEINTGEFDFLYIKGR